MAETVTLILASASPRRRDLLAGLGLSFRVVAADIDETPQAAERPPELVRRLSLAKAKTVAASHPDAVVIAADTVVVVDGEILNKPDGPEQNRQFLERLSGRLHEVHTGHAILVGKRHVSEVITTGVRFRKLLPLELDWYVSTGEGLDKAGGYGIQGYGAALVDRIDGCYFNVVGLSVACVIELARSLGVELVAAH